MKFWSDFKAFAMKGNVMDMAVGVIVGGAFGSIVTSLVNDIIMPPIGALTGGVQFAELKLVIQEATDSAEAVTINYGSFLQCIINFFIIALSVFLMVRVLAKADEKLHAKQIAEKKAKEEAEKKAKADEPTAEKLLIEIRDILKEKQ